MIKAFKIVLNDIKQYNMKNYYHYFSLFRLKFIFIKALKRTKYLWILSLIILIYVFIPFNKNTEQFMNVYKPQIIAFNVIAILFLMFIIVFFSYLFNDYKNHFKDSYKHFLKVMKVYVFVFTMFIMTVLGYSEIYYINHYLTPPLEACTYYDWYGNEIYYAIGFECQQFNEITVSETDGIKTLEFNVLAYHYYEEYKYTYQFERIIGRQSISYYNLTDEQTKNIDSIDKKNIEKFIYTDAIYLYEQDHYSYKIQVKIGDDKYPSESEEVIDSRRMNNEEVLLTIETTSPFLSHPKKQEYIINKNDNQYTLDDYSVEFKNNYIEESFDYSPLIKNAYYTYVEDKELYMINKAEFLYDSNQTNEESITFSFKYKGNLIEQYDDSNHLTYKHLIKETEYGYNIMHYSYRKDFWGRFKKFARPCYFRDRYRSFNYFSDLVTYKQEEIIKIFYIPNPLFLEYEVLNKE